MLSMLAIAGVVAVLVVLSASFYAYRRRKPRHVSREVLRLKQKISSDLRHQLAELVRDGRSAEARKLLQREMGASSEAARRLLDGVWLGT